MASDLQNRMFAELDDKEPLEAAKQCAFDYLDKTQERRIYPSAADIEALRRLSTELPRGGVDAATIINDLHNQAARGCVNNIGGRYFGLVTGGVLPVALAARWLADAWDQNAPLFKTSPTAAIIEEICENWMRDLFGLPDGTVAGFVSGSSLAIFSGLAAARYRIFQNQGWDVNAKGLAGAPPVRIVSGRHAHATVVKAVALLGLGIDNVEWVDVDDQGRIMADRVPALDDKTILLLQAGNVNSGAFDDFASLCARADDAGAWTHVDGAFGLWAAASPRLQHLTAGMERARSWSVDAHKTLNTPYDGGIILCRDEEALNMALHAAGSYLVQSEDRDGMFYTPELSRRARAIEIWAALRYLGREGIDALVTGLHERAAQFAEELSAEGFNVLNDIVFNQILIGYGDDGDPAAFVKHIQDGGECWVGGATWEGRPVIRISVCSWATTPEDITRSVKAFVAARKAVAG